MENDLPSPVECKLANYGRGLIVEAAEEIPEDLASVLELFNDQLNSGSDFVDSSGYSFDVATPITNETVKKLEYALCCQSQRWIKLTCD